MPDRMKPRRNKKKGGTNGRIENPDGPFTPSSIEITVDGGGTVWFASSAPIFEKEKGVKNNLCG
ncbi:MAG: hypothetical protein JW957_03950 [Candidatus Omnitrophica bacterium]|nr:hypothetical protein [Candidatus Omnitrophota bacterium]